MNQNNLDKITDVVGIVIWTDKLDLMTAFYKDTLQLPVHSEKPDFVSFDFGKFRLNIGTHSKITGNAKDPYRVMIHLSVGDIHYWHHRLVSRKVNFIRKPEKETWGGMVATFEDPDGNLIQLLQL